MSDQLPDRDVLLDYIRRYSRRVRVTPSGQVYATCPMPGHDDSRDSFSFNLAKGVWMCHSGCGSGNFWQLVAEIEGVSVAEAASSFGYAPGQRPPKKAEPRPSVRREPPKQARPEQKVEAVYTYEDAEGETRFQVVRCEGKRFHQRVPDGKGGYTYTLGDVDRDILYQLPRVLRTLARGGRVWLVEGEKDADNMNALLPEDDVATTAAGGSKAWERAGSKFAEVLREAQVCAIPDRDTAGCEWARGVLASLNGNLTFWKVGEGKDATDHLEAGLRFDDLREISPQEITDETWMIADAEVSDVASWVTEPYPRVEWIVDSRIARGDCSLLVGPSGAKKTWLSYSLALAVAAGQGPWGLPPMANGPVLVVDEENPPDEAHRRVYVLARGMGIEADVLRNRLMFTSPCQGLSFRDDIGFRQVMRLVYELKPLAVLLDSVTAIGSFKDDNSASEVRRFYHEHLYPLRRICNSAIIGIHHTNKAIEWGQDATDLAAFIRGSVDWRAAADSVMMVTAEKEKIDLHSVKIRRGLAPEKLTLGLENDDAVGGLYLSIDRDSVFDRRGPAEAAIRIVELLEDKTYMTVRDLDNSLIADGFKPGFVRQARETMAVEGQVLVGSYYQVTGRKWTMGGRPPKCITMIPPDAGQDEIPF